MMIARIQALLFGSSRDLAQAASVKQAQLAQARKARAKAIAAVHAAEARRDDRDLGLARMVALEATTACLRLERAQ